MRIRSASKALPTLRYFSSLSSNSLARRVKSATKLRNRVVLTKIRLPCPPSAAHPIGRLYNSHSPAINIISAYADTPRASHSKVPKVICSLPNGIGPQPGHLRTMVFDAYRPLDPPRYERSLGDAGESGQARYATMVACPEPRGLIGALADRLG